MKGDENGWKTAKLKQKRRENVDEEQKERPKCTTKEKILSEQKKIANFLLFYQNFSL